MTAYTVPAIGDKVRNVFSGRDGTVTDLSLFIDGGQPCLWLTVADADGTNVQGHVFAFEPLDDVIDAEVVSEACCPACAEAAIVTGRDEHDVINRPWLARPIAQLVTGDVLRSSGAGPHVLGDVTREGRKAFVQWRDRDSRDELTGGIAFTLIRPADR